VIAISKNKMIVILRSTTLMTNLILRYIPLFSTMLKYSSRMNWIRLGISQKSFLKKKNNKEKAGGTDGLTVSLIIYNHKLILTQTPDVKYSIVSKESYHFPISFLTISSEEAFLQIVALLRIFIQDVKIKPIDITMSLMLMSSNSSHHPIKLIS
jgi:hypothetical protein